MNRARTRKASLAAVAVATVILTWLAAGQGAPAPGVVAAARRPSAHPTRAAVRLDASAPAGAGGAGVHAAPNVPSDLAGLRAPLSPEAAHDPFSVMSWLPPPPKPKPMPKPVALPPPKPVAPPLPFEFVGRLETGAGGRMQAFLSSGERLLVVAAGDMVDGRYRVEAIAPSAVTLTYLPLNEKQILPIQEGN